MGVEQPNGTTMMSPRFMKPDPMPINPSFVMQNVLPICVQRMVLVETVNWRACTYHSITEMLLYE